MRDDDKKWQNCVKVFELIDEGKIIPYCSDIVFLEIYFVLTSVYSQDKREVVKDLATFLKLRNLVLIKNYDLGKALKLVAKVNVKFADCLISTQIPRGMDLCSYDKEFKKIKNVKLVLPEEIV